MKTKIREQFINRKSPILNIYNRLILTGCLMILILTGLTTRVVMGQQSPDRGAKIGNSYSVGDFETVNTTNGNLMLNFPLGSLPAGRGEVGAGINLIYNSKLYDSRVEKIKDERYTCSWEIEGPENCRYYQKNVIQPSNNGGWKYGATYGLEFENRLDSYGQNPPECRHPLGGPTQYWQEMTYIHKLRVVFPDGSTHEMIPGGQADVLGDRFYRIRMDGSMESCGYGTTPGPRPVYYSVDGTYVRLESTTDFDWTLYFSDGRKVVNSSTNPQRIYDRNGNYVEYRGFTNYNNTGNPAFQAADQFNRTITLEYNGVAPGEDAVRMKGFDGEELVWKVKWKTIGVTKSYKACIGGESVCPAADLRSILGQTMSVIDKITQPPQLGGQSYTFSYNAPAIAPVFPQTSNGWGEVSGIQLPTGAQISYSYAMDGQDGGDDEWSLKEILRNYPNSKTLTYNQEYDGVVTPVTETWGYGTSNSGGGVTKPDGSWTADYFNNTDIDSWDSGLTFKSITSDGTMKENLWQFNLPVARSRGLGSGINPYIKTEFTSIKDPNNSSPNYTLTAIKDYTYDKNGNVIEVREYDWIPYANVPRDQYGQITGIPSGISPKRITANGYYAATPEASTITTNGNLYIWANSPKLKHATAWTETRDGNGTPFSRSEMFYDNSTTGPVVAGNLTGTRAWDLTKGEYSNPLTNNNSIATATAYNSYGMPTLTTDAKGNQTQITYGSIIGPTGAVADLYPTQVVSAYGTAISQTAQTEYDFYTGLATKSTALGNTTAENVSSETIYDAVGRPKIAKAAIGITGKEAWTQTDYDDQARITTVKSDLFAKGDGRKVGIQYYDQLGRVFLTRSLEDSTVQSATNIADGIKVQTRYLTTNPYSYQLVSNPYRAATSAAAASEPTMGWTRSKSINTGRHSETENFSGASLPAPWGANTNSSGVASTDSDANRTLVTDQAGKQRISQTNALGQLTDVWEVTAPDSSTVAVSFNQSTTSGYQTSYQYDALGKMVKVQQGSQSRYFKYDSLGRLLRVRQPEQQVNQALATTGDPYNNQWTAGFTYDDNGNVLTTTDSKNTTITNNNYDALNRPASKTYSDGITPTVTYTYDDPNVAFSKGKLTKVVNANSISQTTEFDVLGRPKTYRQITDGQTYQSSYEYNLSGALTQETYPSGRTVKNDLDANGDLSKIYGRATPTAAEKTYADTFVYTADGKIKSLRLGNNLWESAKFNSRLQVTELNLGNSATDGSLWKLGYDYGELNTNGTVDATKNAGNIAKQTISFNGLANPFVQTYKYDALNRLKEAKEVSGNTQTWQHVLNYDRYGNRLREGSSKQIGNSFEAQNNLTFPVVDANTATNRFSDNQGYDYDKNGNIITDPTDGGRQFTFDGENKQTLVKDASNNVIGTYYYDGEGKRVKKVTNLETTVFVYSGGKLIQEYSTAAPPANPTTNYTATDQLGSPRVITDASGTVVSRRDFMPFGEQLTVDGVNRTSALKYNTGTDSVRQKFTGYQRDEETQLDFAEARYYNNQHGRFTAVDPLLASGKSANPQTFNRYAYAMNRPLSLTDKSGLQAGAPAPDYRGAVYTNGNGGYSSGRTDEFKSRYRGGTTYVSDNGYEYRITRGGWSLIGIPATSSSPVETSSASTQQLPSDVYTFEGKGVFSFLKSLAKSLTYVEAAKRGYDDAMNDPAIQFAMNASMIGAPLSIEANIAREAELADEAVVIRNGEAQLGSFANGSGVTSDANGILSGVSVKAANNMTAEELAGAPRVTPNGKIGVSTHGEIKAAGGTIIPDNPVNPNNPYHCEICGLTDQQLYDIFSKDIRPNPYKPR